MDTCRTRFLDAAILWLGMAVLAPGPVHAAWPTDPLVNVPICTKAGNQFAPTIVADGFGGAIITWYDRRNGTDHDIYAQHVRATGSVDPAWPADGVAVCSAQGDQQYPVIATDGAHGAIITWYDGRGTDQDIFVQHVLSSGAVDPTWPGNGRALCATAGNQLSPTIIPDGGGGAIVAWYDDRSGDLDIYAGHVLATGAVDPNWPSNGRALCTAMNDQDSPVITDGSGGAIVAWYDRRSGTNYDIYAQHVQSGGTVDPSWPGNGRAVCTAVKDQYSPVITSDAAGGAFVAWYDYRTALDYDIYAQHVLASGVVDAAWPGNGLAVCVAADNQQYPRLIADGSGGAIVTWEDERSGTNTDIYAQRLRASGSIDPAWPPEGRALCVATGDQSRPTAVSDGIGGAIVAWYDIRNGSNYDIYAQRVLANGPVDPGWPPDGRALCTAAGSQSATRIVGDGSGGAIVTWQDLRNGSDYDIYAQRVQSNGQLGGAVSVDENRTGTIALDAVFPNPARGDRLQVSFSLGATAGATLELFDVAGRRVSSLDVSGLGPGPHVLGMGKERRLAPGLYLLLLRQGPDARVTRVAVLD